MRKDRGVPRRRVPASEDTPARKMSRQLGLLSRQHGDLGEVAFLHKATELGFMVAQPYGTMHPFDFIVQGGQRLWRVQVKAAAHMRKGLYCVNIYRSEGKRIRPYLASEVDFIAVYIMPDDVWFIVPVREVVDRRMLMFRPKGCHRRDLYAHYREAWHLLREPDGLVFG
jgi:PD-(D/E)XK endonuclease